ncbi:MAG: hypothetical protein K9N05_05200 [Candidatus Marinimicrobia bacterium]|nr:hypothetical protein [Candidatus Neomarinimicrobiota bacterium]
MKKSLLIFVLILLCGTLLAQEPDTLVAFQGKMRSPALSIGLSAVFPGGGQLYNQKWLKGTIFMGTELALGGIAAYHYYKHVNNINSTLFGGDDPLTTAKQFTWFFAAVYVYSLMDAYVDAHLSNFPNERLILEPDPKIKGIQLSYQF